jgi:quinol monooxygenase YgiN
MAEKRVDPEDGATYTWDELSQFYKGKYKKKEIEAYWESCKPAKKAKSKAKSKAKAKAEAEPKAEPKAKAKVKAKAKAKAPAKEAEPTAKWTKVKKPRVRKPFKPEPICLVVQLEIEPDRVDEFITVMTKDLEGSRTEPGCLRFDLLRDQADANKFTLFEVYKDADALAAHREMPHFKLWGDFKQNGNPVKSQAVQKCDGFNYLK